MSEFVDAYDTRTGRIGRVPRDFIGDPIVGKFLKLTPLQKALDEGVDVPDEDATVADLKDFAETVDIDLTGLTVKGDIAETVACAMGGENGALPVTPDPNAPAGDTDLDTPDPDDQSGQTPA
jgi:hypothetical protein